MPVTKNQFERQEILHGLLMKNRLTREELLERVNDRLSQIDLKSVIWRTIHNDIEALESKGADIHRPGKGDNRYYYKSAFDLYDTGITEEDLSTLRTGIEMLRGIKILNIGEEVEDILRQYKGLFHTLPDETGHFIEFEQHTFAEGTIHLDNLIEAIRSKTAMQVVYKPFYQHSQILIFHPYLLKQYRNRWFVFGWNAGKNCLFTLALDRIQGLKPVSDEYIGNATFNPDDYFGNLIGVTWPENARPETLRLLFTRQTAPYVLSKKIHPSQQLIKHHDDGSILIELKLVVNYELKSVLLGFGTGVKVMEPEFLRQEILKIYQDCIQLYHSTPEKGL